MRGAPGPGRRNPGAVIARVGSVLAIASVAACLGEPAERTKGADTRGELEEGVAARVGGEVITIEQVRAVAVARGISLQEARTAVTYDALFAAEARARGLERRADVEARVRGELARALVASIRDRAEREPITDEEVARHTALNWLDMDRPVARKTVHAVVMTKDPANEEQRKKASVVATQIAEAVRGETNPDAFIKKAKSVDAQGLKVVAQTLSPVTEDGRQADLKNRPPPGVEASRYDEQFVKAVFRLEEVGEQATDVRTSFGTHVIMLLGIQPALVHSFERRRALLTEEIRAVRVKTQMDELLARLSSETPHETQRNAESILSTLTMPEVDGGH